MRVRLAAISLAVALVSATLTPARTFADDTDTSSGAELSEEEIQAQLRTRNEIATIHRAFGVATWASMAVTAVLGWIQFADRYGFHGSADQTACANGTAVFNDFCDGQPWPHAIAAFTTTALYLTTAGLSFAMPAPLEVSEDVEIHRTLRWFHFGALLATAIFGFVTSSIDADFQTRQALAGVHQGLAVTTFGLLTAAAAVIVF